MSQFAFCGCDKPHDKKQLMGGKGVLYLAAYSPLSRKVKAETHGRDLEARTLEESCLLAHSGLCSD